MGTRKKVVNHSEFSPVIFRQELSIIWQMRLMFRGFLVSFAILMATSLGVIAYGATTTTVVVVVKDERGIPVSDAVVMLYPSGASNRPPRVTAGTMAQKNLAFVPGTLIVGKGSSVKFPNFDRVRHSIYSFSKAARFEIDLYGKDQTRSHSFPIAGSVAVGCNIHDQMRGYIKVVDTPFAAKTDRNGSVTLTGLSTGAATVKIWHPQARGAGNEASYKASLTSGANERKLVLAVRRG
jgi:plastocyanin